MSLPKLLVHTDIFLGYVLHRGAEASALRRAMMKFFCYTTVFNAIELFSLARTEPERRVLESAMSAMKILGLNAKSAKIYGDLLSQASDALTMPLLIAGVCLESKLPLLTDQPDLFHTVRGLKVIRPSLITEQASAAEILSRAKG